MKIQRHATPHFFVSWLILALVFNSAPTSGFAPRGLSSTRITRWSSTDDSSSTESTAAQALSEERKIRASYFLQSSGFSPSKSIISSLLDNESTSDSAAKESMATLEQSNRQSLLNRVNGVGEEYKDYVEETVDEWNKEWEFRQSASKMAAEKSKVKQQERLDTFMAMVRGNRAVEQKDGRASDGRLRFGMPYGEMKEKKTVTEDKVELEVPEAAPLEIVEDTKTDTSIISQTVEEHESEQSIPAETKMDSSQESIGEVKDVDQAPASENAPESEPTHAESPTDASEEEDTIETSIDATKDEQKPLDNLSLVQEVKSDDTSKDDSTPVISEAEKAAAEQRAANAKAAQEKADARKKQILDAENKKKQDAKLQAEALLNMAEEQERLKIEKERADAIERQKKEEEAAELAAKEEESRRQAEELARQQAEEQAAAEKAALEAAEEEARLQAEQEAEAERLHLEARQQRIEAVESKMQSLTDKATSVSFDAKLDDNLYLVGVGVRKKAIINVYSVAMYASPSVLEAVSVFPKGKQKKEAQVALRDAARSFDHSSPQTSFVLEMTFKADGKTIASAIADSVKPRYAGPDGNVKELESLIFEGVKSKGGQATKGTEFRFDCSAQGVTVSVDGDEQGQVECDTLGSAFVDVFMDDKAVSPKLVDSCIETWSGSGL